MPSGTPQGGAGDLRFTAREKRAAAGVVLALLLLAGLWTFGSTSLERWETCRTCLSSRTTRQWGLGTRDGGSFLAAGTVVEMQPTALFHLLSPGHGHEWEDRSTATFFLGSRRFLGCSDGRPNPLVAAFTERASLRDFVEGRMAEGALFRDELAALTSLPAKPAPAWLANPAHRTLLERALLEQGGAGRDADWDRALGR